MSVVTWNVRIFIMERKPKDIGEMSILAEEYLEVHGNTYIFANVDKHRHNLVGQHQSKSQTRVMLAWIDGQAITRTILA